MKVAFFDSGAGGLTVLKTASQLLDQQDFIYFADSQHVPYGPKPDNEVKKYVQAAVDFLASLQPDALVIACNTASSLMLDQLRSKAYPFPILGMEPAVKLASDRLDRAQRLLVTGTQITVQHPHLQQLIDRFASDYPVDTLALDQLVTWVENEMFDQSIVNRYLSQQIPNPTLYQAVVLGCTHFSFYRDQLQDFFGPKTLILDGNQGTANHLIRTLNLEIGQELNNHYQFYFSGAKDPKQEAKYRRLLRRLD